MNTKLLLCYNFKRYLDCFKGLFFFFAKEISCFLKIHVPPPPHTKKGRGGKKKEKDKTLYMFTVKKFILR